jgi:hypothetical protein
MFEPVKQYDYLAITLLNISLDELQNKIKEMLTEKSSSTWVIHENSLSITDILGLGQTMSGRIKRRFVIWSLENNPEKSVFLSNSTDGCETIINASLGDAGDFIRISLSRSDAERFSMFEFKKKSQERVILANLDDKWKFYEKGELLDFENKEYYSRKIIKKRLNYEIINEYLEANNWHLNDPTFWHSTKAIYFVETKWSTE